MYYNSFGKKWKMFGSDSEPACRQAGQTGAFLSSLLRG